MDVLLVYKSPTSINFRQIAKVDNIEVCAIMSNIDNFPMFYCPFTYISKSFPGIAQKCPIKSFLIANASVYNVSLTPGCYEKRIAANGLGKGEIIF